MKLKEIKRAYRELTYYQMRAEEYSHMVNGQWNRVLSHIFAVKEYEWDSNLEKTVKVFEFDYIDVTELYTRAFKIFSDNIPDSRTLNRIHVDHEWLLTRSEQYAKRFYA